MGALNCVKGLQCFFECILLLLHNSGAVRRFDTETLGANGRKTFSKSNILLNLI